MSDEVRNTVGIDIPLPDGKVYNTEYPKLVQGSWVSDEAQELFYRD